MSDCENKYGDRSQQEKASKRIGSDLPDPDKLQPPQQPGKITFDAFRRKMLIETAKRHDLN